MNTKKKKKSGLLEIIGFYREVYKVLQYVQSIMSNEENSDFSSHQIHVAQKQDNWSANY